jgi:hypothetical protein
MKKYPPLRMLVSNCLKASTPAPGVGKSGFAVQARVMNSNWVVMVRAKQAKIRPRLSPSLVGRMRG